ncbi:hypothetical protein [Desulforamulus hydrothermalis]|uniref:hypothetical protein n=1 Tax=Desulforamulus hydrothermalis TaxID=412895 RepID=UPI001F2C7313|nr:hypothetical protein [Desulforamulus hydrothermalis]
MIFKISVFFKKVKRMLEPVFFAFFKYPKRRFFVVGKRYQKQLEGFGKTSFGSPLYKGPHHSINNNIYPYSRLFKLFKEANQISWGRPFKESRDFGTKWVPARMQWYLPLSVVPLNSSIERTVGNSLRL